MVNELAHVHSLENAIFFHMWRFLDMKMLWTKLARIGNHNNDTRRGVLTSVIIFFPLEFAFVQLNHVKSSIGHGICDQEELTCFGGYVQYSPSSFYPPHNFFHVIFWSSFNMFLLSFISKRFC